MACTAAGPIFIPAPVPSDSGQGGEFVPRLKLEVDTLTEEVRQLRAACQIYSELVSRLIARLRPATGEFHGTV
jgi:hypothetical protein